jgi:hypothetical protein
MLGGEVSKLKDELKAMQVAVTKKYRWRNNETDPDEIQDDDTGFDDAGESVRSLRRKLSESMEQLETTRKHLAEEQRLKSQLVCLMARVCMYLALVGLYLALLRLYLARLYLARLYLALLARVCMYLALVGLSEHGAIARTRAAFTHRHTRSG